jgi:hypothetical protein
MKRPFCVFTLIAVLTPLFVGAVTWQADSGPFSFPSVFIDNSERMHAAQSALRCVPGGAKGIVTFEYRLPAAARGAQLNIYSLGGVLVRNFGLQAGETAVRWSTTESKVASGVYLASLRCGAVEQRIRISITK